jgi:hypothetical protein
LEAPVAALDFPRPHPSQVWEPEFSWYRPATQEVQLPDPEEADILPGAQEVQTVEPASE